ncbi:MAG: ATP-binding protein [Candidatus Omnitrophica bacterium]|nr:ATP-binding protein [Candidatus Omnitrophota bacterium]
MLQRMLSEVVTNTLWGRQMRFIVGPRQCGKTTLAKSILSSSGFSKLYYDWDLRSLRLRYQKDSEFLTKDLAHFNIGGSSPWITFDEIHKYPSWKNVLKNIFDSHEPRIRLMVTGSARLDLLRRSGDSLAGRYFVFHLFPLSLHEISTKGKPCLLKPQGKAVKFLKERFSHESFRQRELSRLLAMSGFPEPFLKNSEDFHRKWRMDFIDRLVKGDLRDLTRIEKLEHIAQLLDLLAERVGSPLSVNSLCGILEDSYTAVRNYIRGLRLTYVTFNVLPYSKRVGRSIQKAAKTYLFDWTQVEDEAKRFENYAACELNTWVHLWTDAGFGNYELRYIRHRDGRETDFLILCDKNPWILLEAKLRDQSIAFHHYEHARLFDNIPIVQVVLEDGIAWVGRSNDYRISASRFFL